MWRTLLPLVQVESGTRSSFEKNCVESCVSQNSAASTRLPEGGVGFLWAFALLRPIPLFLICRHVPCGDEPEPEKRLPFGPGHHDEVTSGFGAPIHEPRLPATARDQSMGVFKSLLGLLDGHTMLGTDLLDNVFRPQQFGTNRSRHGAHAYASVTPRLSWVNLLSPGLSADSAERRDGGRKGGGAPRGEPGLPRRENVTV